jgi:hypothetical protein
MIAAGAAAVAALFAFAALGGVGVGQSAIGAAQYKAPKVTICHKAGPNKRVTLSVSANAWPAHQRHGDTLGACSQQSSTQGSKGKGKGKGKGNQSSGAQSGQQSSNGGTGQGNNGKGKGNGQK